MFLSCLWFYKLNLLSIMKKKIFISLLFILICLSSNQTVAQSDARITGFIRLSATGYSHMPAHYLPDTLSFIAIVANDSASTLTNVQMKYSLLKSGIVIQEDSVTVDSIAAGVSRFIGIGSAYTLSEKGSYNVIYQITHDSVDVTPFNNLASPDSIIVGDSILSRSIGSTIAQGLGLPTGTAGEIGTTYFIPKADTLTSITLGISNANGQMTNEELSVNVRSYNNGVPGAIIASSDTITYTETGAAFVRFKFKNHGNYVDLPADSFVVTAVQTNQNISLGTTAAVSFSRVNWAFFNGSWTLLDAQFPGAFMIQLNFGVPIGAVGIDESESVFSTISIFPNPSNGKFTLSIINEKQIDEINVQVLDIKARVIMERVLTANKFIAEPLDLNHFGKGIYFVKFTKGNAVTVKKVIVQ